MLDYYNMVSEIERQIATGMTDAEQQVMQRTLFADPGEEDRAWDPPIALRNNAPSRGPSAIGFYGDYCEGDWLMTEEQWEALIGDDAVALPFCCNATESLRRRMVRIRDFGPSKFRYDDLVEAIDTLLERHFLPEDNTVYELKARLEEWCFDQEEITWSD